MKRPTPSERALLQAKAKSPGVPANTCPYIDEVLRMMKEFEDAYEDLRVKAVPEPLIDKRFQLAQDILEYVRTANETLRDNSLYWYTKYKACRGRHKKE
jgi:hypothetical protein